jgi:hypothetical protein
MVINDLNVLGSRELQEPTEGLSPPPYLDVNADGFVSSIDALQVINELNDQLGGETGEELFPLSLHVLAVPAEGEPFLAEGPVERSNIQSVDQVWADLWFTNEMRWSGIPSSADIDDLAERMKLGNNLPLEEELDELIGDDLLGRSWLEWSADGDLQ